MYAFYALYLAIFAIFASIVYLICGRIIARLLEWLVKRLFKVDIQVGRAQFLALGNIKITTAGVKIDIENIVLQTKWSFLGSRRLLMLCFGHITVSAAKNVVNEDRSLDTNQQGRLQSGGDSKKSQRLAGIVKFISKYMGVYIHSLDVIATNQPRPTFNIVVQVINGMKILCQPNESFLSYSVKATKCVSKLHQTKEFETDYFQDLTLAEVSLNIFIEGTLNSVATTGVLEDLSIKVSPIRISIGDNFIKNFQKLRGTSFKTRSSTAAEGETKSTSSSLSKYLPKNFDVAIAESDVFICDEDQRELSVHIDNLTYRASLAETPSSPDSNSMVRPMDLLINGLKVKARGSKNLVSFRKFMLAIKTQESESSLPSIWSKVYLASCQCNYIHDEVSHWATFLFLEERDTTVVKKRSLPETVINLTKKYSFENNFEIDDMTMYLDTNKNSKLGQDKHVCKAVLASLVTNVEVPSQETEKETKTVNCSARLENAYVYFNVTDAENTNVGILLEDSSSVLPNSRKHLWGRVLELGSSSIKCDVELESSTRPQNAALKCDASSFVLEYSQHTKNCLKALLKTGEFYKRFKKEKAESLKEENSYNSFFQECDVTVHDINIFCVGKCEDGIDSVLARVDVVSVNKEKDDVQIRTHGCKVARLGEVGKEALLCAKSTELNHTIMSLTSAVTSLTSKGATVSLPKIQVDWDTASHMALHDRISGIIEDSKELKVLLAGTTDDAGVNEKRGEFLSNVQLEITTEDVAIEMKTSSVNSFGVQFSGVIKLDDGWLSAESPNIDILFDARRIFQLKVSTASHEAYFLSLT
ncbi:uncharacterized protein LOC114523764 [Dendronephthya gigantea]|uniref:uncharacterized protein LOC114523764 n=1 Tax=Dendronephthya gigantea TaxID=151771 RepID=UPI00106D79BE|nr:uncharacterized protein LOC114523764 [Dendronephthya gigantea]